MTKRIHHFSLEALGDHDSIELKLSVLRESIVDFIDALKVNSTLKSLRVISADFHKIDESVASAIDDVLRVNSALASLDLGDNRICQVGTQAIADALKINSSLTSLNLRVNSIQEGGSIAIADALKINSSLTSLNLSGNLIKEGGSIAIADSLKVNTTLTSLNLSVI
jgi:NLR family CARD domain-containing protein 3